LLAALMAIFVILCNAKSEGHGIAGCPNGHFRDIVQFGSEEAKQWEGWGTALKPAWEPIIVARKPLEGTVAANVLKYGTGALNIDGCRVPIDANQSSSDFRTTGAKGTQGIPLPNQAYDPSVEPKPVTNHHPLSLRHNAQGRWPANLIHDGSEEVLAWFPKAKAGTAVRHRCGGNSFGGDRKKPPMPDLGYRDTGSAARFFYCAKASKKDRDEGLEAWKGMHHVTSLGAIKSRQCRICGSRSNQGGTGPACGHNDWEWVDVLPKPHKGPVRNPHPTVKPTALMRYLCRLVTPPGGIILDPFMGSGSTGKAAALEGFGFIGIDIEPEYVEIAKARIRAAQQKHFLSASN